MAGAFMEGDTMSLGSREDFMFLRKPNLSGTLPKAEDVDVCFLVAVSPAAKELARKSGWDETADGNGQYLTRFPTTCAFLDWLGDKIEKGIDMTIAWPKETLPPFELDND
jgi:hypothetical protein